MKDKEYILCAAIYYDDGKRHIFTPKNIMRGYVVCGRRHHNILNIHADLTNSKLRGRQGFLTSTDEFVDREKAAEIAYNANQIKDKKEYLLSEDLY